MVNCYKVIKKRTEDPENACIVGPGMRRRMKRYIEFVEDFCKDFEIDPELFVINAPQSAVEPLLSYQKESDVYINASKKIAHSIKSKHGVTRRIVQSFMGIKPIPPKIRTSISLNPATPRLIIRGNKKSEITIKNQTLLSITDPPYIAILQDIMKKYDLDNEYAAYIKILTMVKVRK
jgi:hypothetical protein